MIKKGLVWLLVGFLVYYVVSAPDEAAAVVRDIGQTLRNIADSILEFFDGLTP